MVFRCKSFRFSPVSWSFFSPLSTLDTENTQSEAKVACKMFFIYRRYDVYMWIISFLCCHKWCKRSKHDMYFSIYLLFFPDIPLLAHVRVLGTVIKFFNPRARFPQGGALMNTNDDNFKIYFVTFLNCTQLNCTVESHGRCRKFSTNSSLRLCNRQRLQTECNEKK